LGVGDVPDPAQDSTSPTPTPPLKGRGSHVPERTCILSREHGERDGLIRLALSPDGEVFPDVRAKAPGRGAWIGVDKAALEQAIAKGKLRGALARAFKGAPLSIPEDLGARIEAALRQAALDRLGLEARAGTLVTGGEKMPARTVAASSIRRCASARTKGKPRCKGWFFQRTGPYCHWPWGGRMWYMSP
jgi:hypothetical protein